MPLGLIIIAAGLGVAIWEGLRDREVINSLLDERENRRIKEQAAPTQEETKHE